MNKLTTLALAGLVAVSASAVASDSRMAGFGASSAFIADVQDIWTLPAVVASNKNATYFEMGEYYGFGNDSSWCCTTVNDPNDDSQFNGMKWGGVHAQVGPGVLGIWVNRPQSLEIGILQSALSGNLTTYFPSGWAGNGSNVYNNTNRDGRVDLFYAFGIGEKLDLGIHISRAADYAKADLPNNWGVNDGLVSTKDYSALGFGLGVDVKEVAIFKLLQVGLNIDADGVIGTEKRQTQAVEEKYSQSVTVFGVRVGGAVAGDEGKFGRLEFGLTMGGGSAKNDASNNSGINNPGNKEIKATGSAWNLGYALGKAGDKGMGLAGLMIEGISFGGESDLAETKNEQSSLTLALSTAGEAKVKEWLTARAGLSANLFETDSNKSNNTGAGNSDTYTYSNNGQATISTGLSLNFGDLTIDGVLNQDLLFTGSYLVSGLQETLFSKVSATWGW